MISTGKGQFAFDGVQIVQRVGYKTSEDSVVEITGVGVLDVDNTLVEPIIAGIITGAPRALIMQQTKMIIGHTYIDGTVYPVNNAVNVSYLNDAYGDNVVNSLKNNLIEETNADENGKFSFDLVNDDETKDVVVWSEIPSTFAAGMASSMDISVSYSNTPIPEEPETPVEPEEPDVEEEVVHKANLATNMFTIKYTRAENTTQSPPTFDIYGKCPSDATAVYVSSRISYDGITEKDDIIQRLMDNLLTSVGAKGGSYQTGEFSAPYTVYDPNCYKCNGTGTIVCDSCHGSGRISNPCVCDDGMHKIQCETCSSRGVAPDGTECSDCEGHGYIVESCSDCGGSGYIEEFCSACDGIGNLGACDCVIYTNTSSDFSFDVIVWCTTDMENGSISAEYSVHEVPTCLAGNTLILLADGTQKEICSLSASDVLMAGDHTPTKITQITCGIVSDHHMLYYFDDGTVIDEAHKHRFYNVDAGHWMYLDKWKIGDRAKHYDGSTPKLVRVERVNEPCRRYGLWTESHDYFAENLLSGETAANQSVLANATIEQVIAMLSSLSPDKLEKLYEGELG